MVIRKSRRRRRSSKRRKSHKKRVYIKKKSLKNPKKRSKHKKKYLKSRPSETNPKIKKRHWGYDTTSKDDFLNKAGLAISNSNPDIKNQTLKEAMKMYPDKSIAELAYGF